MITNIVFSGAGIKIYAFIGVLKALKEHDLLKNIKSLIGTSAGALISIALCLDYDCEEIEELMLKIKIDKLKDFSSTDIINCFNTYGIDNGSNFKRLFKIIIKAKTKKDNITFKELYELTKKKITITATCVNSMETTYFNYEKTPDFYVEDALLMSISIPFLFTPVKHDNKLYIDGGLTNNYPIDFFEDDLKNTLGILITTSINKCYDINNIEDYVSSIFLSSYYKLLRNCYNKYINNTILLENTFNFIDFNISMENKKELIEFGYKDALTFITSDNFKTFYDL
jgi:NTE family protein